MRHNAFDLPVRASSVRATRARRALLATTVSSALALVAGCGDDDASGVGASGAGAASTGGSTTGIGGTSTATGGTGGSIEPFDEEGWHPSSERDPSFFEQPDELFRIHPTRPRLYFRSDDIDWMLARAAGPLSAVWSNLQWMASSMAEEDPAGAVATANVKDWYGAKGQAVALLALLQGNETYRAWATAWAKALGALEMPTDDTLLRSRLERLAVVYDWLHDSFDEADRAEIYEALVRYVETLRDWGYIESPGYIGGHERWGYAVFAMGLIALDGEYPDAEPLLAQCREHIVRGFYPAQAWIADDGGYHMGWAYSASYTNFDQPYLVWTVGTNDVVLDDWMARTCDYYIHGLQSDRKLPAAADAFSIAPSAGTTNCIYAQGIGNRPAARWFIENVVEPTSEPLLQLLLWDPAIAASAPDAPSPDGLPLGRHFRRAGVVVARDRWDEGATHFTFKSGSFFSINHHHRDDNSFTLHYRSPLALDSGYYDRYGSPHWRNYFTRTVAHNAVIVFDPAQQMTLYGNAVSNDGGQLFRQEPRTLEEIEPGGHASLAGIVRFETRDELTYALGNATAAYDTTRVTRAEREVVYLRSIARPHPAIVVFDRVASTSAAFQKRFLLHTVEAPTISGSLAVAAFGEGRITSATVYPPNALLGLVGGAGSEFRVDGVNYPLELGGSGSTPESKGIFPGAWRLEVSPATASLEDFFLHVLFVDDVGAPAVTASEAQLVSGVDALGVKVADWVVVFGRPSGTLSHVSYSVPVAGSFRHLVAGFAPGQSVTYSVGATAAGTVLAGDGGCALFELDASSGATVTVQ